MIEGSNLNRVKLHDVTTPFNLCRVNVIVDKILCNTELLRKLQNDLSLHIK